ncbi:MAG: YCF48-related protein [Desulfuromonadaceae bacterium]|nr:YCF48-related protein [Desulfuromonadaceae bacterium]
MNYRRWQHGIIQGMFLMSTVAFATGTADPVYRDVLDTPSRMSNLASGTLLNSIVSSGKRLIAVGHRGHIVYSDDQGKTWTQSTVPVGSDLVAVYFPSDKNGWSVGHDGVVLHTADGGTTWTKQLDGRIAAELMSKYFSNSEQDAGITMQADIKRYQEQGPDKPFLDVWFQNDTTGYIVGAFGFIFRTVDGGKSWIPLLNRIDNPKNYHLYAIKPVGSDLYICGEQGSLFKLDATGYFKGIKTPYTGTYFGITGKPGALIIYGMRGKVFRSGDNGKSWKNIETGVPAGITGSTILEDGRIVLVSQIGNVLISDDNGATFKHLKVEKTLAAADVTSVNKDTLVIVGFRGANIVPVK